LPGRYPVIKMTTMQKPGKVLVASQYYLPDSSTTSVYMAAIVDGLAADREVVVLSGSPGSMSRPGEGRKKPSIIEIRNWTPRKDALIRRSIAILLLALRMFFSTLAQARRNDIVFCVTTPVTLPYAVILAARLRGAATALLIYDLYPEALEMAELIKPRSVTARLIRLANTVLFRSLDAIITIGRDVEALLLAYKGVTQKQINFIPNWTLLPVGYRELTPDNRFRTGRHSQLVVGLSGNLGFTHSPRTVFEAARLLKEDKDIHLILSGWGIGWNELCDLQAADRLDNITLLDPVPEAELVEFLSSADVWIIPYRRNIAGVSVPSRLYNLLAVGRSIIVAAESHSEAALVIREENIGWVVPPEDPRQLADAIRFAASDRAATIQKGRRAAEAAKHYSPNAAMARYREVLLKLR
jgi:colanic acid biosynthesis glycosyl transferase WcaI